MKSIFKWFVYKDAVTRIEWFVNKFTPEEFEGVDKVLLLFLRYCSRLGIYADRKYLEAYMKTDCKMDVKAFNIKLQGMNNFNYSEPASLEEAFRVIMSSTYETFDQYVSNPVTTEDNFKVVMDGFLSERKKERLVSVMSDTFSKVSSGDSIDYLLEEMQYQLKVINDSYDRAYLDKLDFLEGRDGSAKQEDLMRHLFNTGIPCIDGDIGGMYSKQVWAFTGSPGSGKTLFACAHMAYRAMIQGIDVLFDELEMSKAEIRNMLIAIHIPVLFKGTVKIPDTLMNKDQLTVEQRKYYEAAKIDLFESGKYGKISIRTDDLIVETLEDSMLSYLRHNRNTQLWIVDYAGLAKSKPTEKYAPHKNEYEVITELYRTAGSIARTADIGVFIVNQFNREGVTAAELGKKISAGHIQGGQAIERFAYYDLAMTMTVEQELANMAMMSTVKKRGAVGFNNVPFKLDRSISSFMQLEGVA